MQSTSYKIPTPYLFMNMEHLERRNPGFANYLKEHRIELAEHDFPIDTKTGEQYTTYERFAITTVSKLYGQYGRAEIGGHQAELERYMINHPNDYMFSSNGCKLRTQEREVGDLLNTSNRKLVQSAGIGNPFTKEELVEQIQASNGKIILVEVDGIPQILVKKDRDLPMEFEDTEPFQHLRQEILKKLVGAQYDNMVDKLFEYDRYKDIPDDIRDKLREGDYDALMQLPPHRRGGRMNSFYDLCTTCWPKGTVHTETGKQILTIEKRFNDFVRYTVPQYIKRPIIDDYIKQYKHQKEVLVNRLVSAKGGIVVNAHQRYNILEKEVESKWQKHVSKFSATSSWSGTRRGSLDIKTYASHASASRFSTNAFQKDIATKKQNSIDWTAMNLLSVRPSR